MSTYRQADESDIGLDPPPAKPVYWIATNSKNGDQVEILHKLWYYVVQEAAVTLGCEPCQVRAIQKQDISSSP